jgi:O-antigen/teichoic acid export membrane protein
MRIPRLSKICVTVHTVIALLIFLAMWANNGGYHNGWQWGLLGLIDFPIFMPLSYLPEGESRFNPALMSDMALNGLFLGYALLFGSLWWMTIGWMCQRFYEKIRSRRGSTHDA